MIRLEQECEKLKKQMSSYAQALPFNIECFMEEKDVSAKMSREEFEGLSQPLFARVEATTQVMLKLLGDVGINPAEIYAIEVVGGASRIPAVKSILSKAFGKELSTTLNLDEVGPGFSLCMALLRYCFNLDCEKSALNFHPFFSPPPPPPPAFSLLSSLTIVSIYTCLLICFAIGCVARLRVNRCHHFSHFSCSRVCRAREDPLRRDPLMGRKEWGGEQ